MPKGHTGRAGRRARLRKHAATKKRGSANNTFALYEVERTNYNEPQNLMNVEAIMNMEAIRNVVRRQLDPQMHSKPKKSRSRSGSRSRKY